jgi:hypothetical protein
MLRRNLLVLAAACGFVVCATLALPAPVLAQEEMKPNDALPGNRASAPRRAGARVALSPEQFEAFAQLIGEPRPVVWQHLLADPGLVPLAAAAADERMSRKSSGKARTIVGFTILGAGVIAGYLILLSSIRDVADCSSAYSCNDNFADHYLLALLVMGASTGIGLGIGIPGIVSMARQSEVETNAVDRYQYPHGMMPPPPYYPAYPPPYGLGSPRSLKLPLLSFAF